MPHVASCSEFSFAALYSEVSLKRNILVRVGVGGMAGAGPGASGRRREHGAAGGGERSQCSARPHPAPGTYVHTFQH